MLRSKLEQQLFDTTFEEDIDEERTEDISGRARFLIRDYTAKVGSKERSRDFDRYITVPGYSSSLLSCSINCGMTALFAAIPMCSAPTPP